MDMDGDMAATGAGTILVTGAAAGVIQATGDHLGVITQVIGEAAMPTITTIMPTEEEEDLLIMETEATIIITETTLPTEVTRPVELIQATETTRQIETVLQQTETIPPIDLTAILITEEALT
jgi:hypothetical protein